MVFAWCPGTCARGLAWNRRAVETFILFRCRGHKRCWSDGVSGRASDLLKPRVDDPGRWGRTATGTRWNRNVHGTAAAVLVPAGLGFILRRPNMAPSFCCSCSRRHAHRPSTGSTDRPSARSDSRRAGQNRRSISIATLENISHIFVHFFSFLFLTVKLFLDDKKKTSIPYQKTFWFVSKRSEVYTTITCVFHCVPVSEYSTGKSPLHSWFSVTNSIRSVLWKCRIFRFSQKRRKKINKYDSTTTEKSRENAISSN